jgi:hypothetical protein
MLAPIPAAHKDSGEAADERASRPGRLLRSLPDLAVFIIMAVCASPVSWQLVLLPTPIRAALLDSVALHGPGQSLAAGRRFRARVLEHARNLPLQGLLPFAPLLVPGFTDPAAAPTMPLTGLSRTRRRLAALGAPGPKPSLCCCAGFRYGRCGTVCSSGARRRSATSPM